MKCGFIKVLVDALNLDDYYSDSVNTNFTVEDKQIVCSFDGNPDVENYIKEVGNEMIELFIGSKELADKLFDLRSFPFSSDGAKRIYDEDRRVKALKFDVTPEVEQNCKLLFAMAFMDYIGNEMKGNFEQNPRTTNDQMEAICAFVQSITVGRIGEPINDLYSICLDGVKSADPLMSRALKRVYINTLETQLKKCGIDSSEFFELNDDVLSIKDITNVRIVNNIAEHTAWRIARHFAHQGDENSKVKNITDVFRRKIFQLTKVNGKNGILIDGYDCDASADKDARDAGNDFALILKIAISDTEVRDITKEEADRINEAFKGFGGILIDIRGQTEKTEFTDSEDPVYGIPHERFALLIPELMKSPLAYNEASKCFEYGISLGNFLCQKLETHSASEKEPHASVSQFTASSGNLGVMREIENQRQLNKQRVISQKQVVNSSGRPSHLAVESDASSSGFSSRNSSSSLSSQGGDASSWYTNTWTPTNIANKGSGLDSDASNKIKRDGEFVRNSTSSNGSNASVKTLRPEHQQAQPRSQIAKPKVAKQSPNCNIL